ncbi:MAG: tRNA 2-thiouridine(34) synthase MnmA [Clostridiales bacterium]|nr:tRNA 2-thiouridine(34) synthase MnmA [Candidatus Equinaster intestinalis]
MSDKRVITALSGGVDSSVAAKLIRDMGYENAGIIMRLIGKNDPSLTSKDVEDAKAVAEKLGIDFFVCDFFDEFENCVINRFVLAYEQGLTPNPCIECNRYMKFGKLYEKAKELGYDYIATGHYAKIERNEKGRYIVKKAEDKAKDQSYVLYCLTQEQLSHTILPLGSLTKAQIREIASQNGFINADKKDSQDICFVKDGDYAAFIKNYTGKEYPHGNYTDKNGKVLGEHKGIINYTIGQRKGLGIALGAPAFVLDKNTVDNTVVLGEEKELYFKNVIVENVNFVSVEGFEKPMRVMAKLRYRHAAQPAVAEQLGSNTVRLIFDEPQRAPTPGQSAVFYDEDILLGGGIIRGGEY